MSGSLKQLINSLMLWFGTECVENIAQHINTRNSYELLSTVVEGDDLGLFAALASFSTMNSNRGHLTNNWRPKLGH